MNTSGPGHTDRHFQLLCITGAVLCCAGCWQEVRYNPERDEAKSSVVQAVATEDAGRSSDESPAAEAPEAQEPSTRVENDLAAEATTEELFGTPDPSAETNIDQTSEEEPEDSVESLRPAAPDSTASAPGKKGSELFLDVPANESTTSDKNSSDPFFQAEPMRPSRTAVAAWRMASRWSLAAAIYAKGQPEQQYREALDQAIYAAELIGAELPELPSTNTGDLEAEVISLLLASNPISFDEELAPEYRSLTELAIKTHLLLLVYTPKSNQLDALIASIRQAAENSGLPAELWSDLVSMIDRREPFADVKREVLTFHQRVGEYLAGDS